MRVTRLFFAGLVVFSLAVGLALAQEGHPLKGSWIGDWGPNRTTRNQVFVVIDWDGKALSGMINPGTDNFPLLNAMLTPPPPPPAPAGGGGGRGGGGGQGGGGGRGGGGAQGGGQGAAPAAGAAAAGGGRGAAAPAAPAAGGAAAGGGRGAAAPAAPAVPPAPAPPRDWLVHFEADAKGVRHVVDGKIENIGLPNRAVVGTWTVGTTKNDFRIVRQ